MPHNGQNPRRKRRQSQEQYEWFLLVSDLPASIPGKIIYGQNHKK